MPINSKLNGIKPDQIDTLSKKNIFPYIWFDNYGRVNAISLPGREHFNQHVDQQKNDEDYDYAIKAWEKLECKTFEEYHDKYLLADIVLLATCFHAFRRNICKMHVTDPAYFLGLPGYLGVLP